MKNETTSLTPDEMKAICEKTKTEMLEYAPYVEASLTTLEAFIPRDMHVTIIIRKDDEAMGPHLAGAMIRTNDDITKLVHVMTPLAKATIEHPTEFR